MVTVEYDDFASLLSSLKKHDYTLIGQGVDGNAIVLRQIDTPDDLPSGYHDIQEPGKYRIEKNGDGLMFGYTAGPQSWKQYLYPSSLKLYSVQKQGKRFTVSADEEHESRKSKYAFIGMRPCDLHAMLIHDKVFQGGTYADGHYKSLREQVFILAVNCINPGRTCFCDSMETGPQASSGYDLALTEVRTKDSHYFVADIGSSLGEEVLRNTPHRKSTEAESSAVSKLIENARKKMGKRLETKDIQNVFFKNYQHPHWEEVGAQCLSCANCTMVCPTCFCSTVEDVTDLSGAHAERWRKWDSCFTGDFSYIHGGIVRASVKTRYRQWITHKLAAWIDQFGTSGCVGCGRCITWCPVGIDITEEAKIIRETTTAG